ncbi:MAG: diguanylate cyclase [Gemmatimonadetes bacterium]|nr:diguanylate cyclase [Gemmatimonadota bacterium]MBK7922840.1 diguanylate cyclase [Gemmatimonadota bacterium]
MTHQPRILVADDDQALTRTLSWILKEHEYDVVVVNSGESLLDRLAAEPYDLLMLDIMMPGSDGLVLLERVKADPRVRDVPVLMISSMPPEEATVRALGLGAADFISKPFRVRELLARVKAHLRVGRELNQARAEARSRSEMVDILQEVTASLKPEEIYHILVRRVARGLKISKCSLVFANPGEETAVVVASYENPMLRDLPIELRRYPEIRRALDARQTVLVTDVATDPLYAEARESWETGGVAVPTRSAIAIPFVMRDQRAGVFFLRTTAEDTPLNQSDLTFAEQVIRAAVQALEKAYDLESAVLGREHMKTLAETDPLTETFNRRALADKLVQEIERANRYGTQLACLMVDVDNFKQINDAHGHLAGDVVLRQLGGILRREQRAVDIVARFGGEEFVVILPETVSGGARIFAERVIRKVAGHPFGEGGQAIHVTVSVGIACYPDDRVQDSESLLKLADQNLYKAKQDGRNRYRD